MIASVSTSSKIVVEKSTVPVKTAEAIEKVLLPSLPMQAHAVRAGGGRLLDGSETLCGLPCVMTCLVTGRPC